MEQKISQNESVEAIAQGLLALTPDERQELDRIVTPRAAQLMAKAFGPEFYDLMRPLTEADGPDGQPEAAPAADPAADPAEGRRPEEAELRRLMRDPRYWRDKDPSVLDQVSQGFSKLYG